MKNVIRPWRKETPDMWHGCKVALLEPLSGGRPEEYWMGFYEEGPSGVMYNPTPSNRPDGYWKILATMVFDAPTLEEAKKQAEVWLLVAQAAK